MEEVVLLLGVCGLVVFLLPLILALVLWSRVGRLQAELEALALRVRHLSTGVKPLAEPDARPVAVADIEIVRPPAPQPAATLAVEPPTAPAAPLMPPLRERPTAAFEPQAPAAAELAQQEVEAAEISAGLAEPREPFSLEELLAGRWLTWVGALAVIIGAGLFFKYTIENRWIDETGRVAIGLIVGTAAFAGAAFAMLRDYRWVGQALAGAAAGILYFALYAAFGFYRLVPLEAAFAGMALVTIAVLAFSTIFNSQPTALIGLIGGFLTPLMLSQGVDRQWELFAYIFVLDLGVLGIAGFRRWQPLQITAFVGTLLIWTGWFARFWEPDKLQSTLLLMTAFFVLFALLGVWHNAWRRLPARPGDLFLMLATPVAYFIALYAVTKEDYERWHGLMAVGLGGVYLGLAALQQARHPAGRLAVLALGGVAASFLTVAIPLQWTGHWIAVAWAAESLLLVELGLRFRESKLRWAGFGLLLVVQLILCSYAVETLENPHSFSTRFTQIDPGTGLLPIGVAAPQPAERPAPSWTDIFNGRSLSFLASAVVLAVLAWEYRRRPAADEEFEVAAPGWLLALVPLTVLAMLLVETYSLGYRGDWSRFSILGVVTLWSAVVAVAVAMMSVRWGPAWLDRVAAALFAWVGLLLVASLLATLASWRSEWSRLAARPGTPAFWEWALVNPRGLGFVAAILAGLAGAWLYRSRDARRAPEAVAEDAHVPLQPILAVFAHLSGLMLLTTEVYAQGVVRGWDTWTALSITIVWLLYAIATLLSGIYYRSATVRVLALLLFAFTAGKVFLYDVWHVSPQWKTVAFTALGLALLMVSFFYRRYRARIRAWLQAVSIVGAALVLSGTGPALAGDPPRSLVETLEVRWPVSPIAPVDPRAQYLAAPLPPALYAVARNDLADIRLIATGVDGAQAAVEIPYVLVQPRDRVRHEERAVALLNLSQLAGDTQFLLDLGDDPPPISELTLEIAAGARNYQRNVRVYGGDVRDAIDALLTDDGLLLDVTRGAERARLNRVPFPQSRFRFYRVVIENDSQPPLAVTAARVAHRETLRVPRREFPARLVHREHDARHNRSVIVADLEYQQLPTSGVRLRVPPDGNFYRRVHVEASHTLDPQPQWRPAATFDIYRMSRAGRDDAEQLETEYPEIRGQYLRITIDNGDDQPLTIEELAATSLDRWFVCESRRFSEPAALYAGNPWLTAPQYDLTRTAAIDEHALRATLQVGPRQANPLFTGRSLPPRAWTEEHRGLVWMLTISGVVIFGLLTALLLWKGAAAAPPSP